jgi:Ca2+-binding RTX toxin-like protein
MNVRGTDGHENIVAYAKNVLIRSLGDKDTVIARGRTVEVIGGRDSDRLVVSGFETATAWGGAGADEIRVNGKATGKGGKGADILRGGDGRQSLYGGSGKDVANGKGGKDLCRAEIQKACEM